MSIQAAISYSNRRFFIALFLFITSSVSNLNYIQKAVVFVAIAFRCLLIVLNDIPEIKWVTQTEFWLIENIFVWREYPTWKWIMFLPQLTKSLSNMIRGILNMETNYTRRFTNICFEYKLILLFNCVKNSLTLKFFKIMSNVF